MRRRFSRKPPACADWAPGDGIDPRLDQDAGRRRAVNRKALQLCEQVAHTLTGVLAGECSDDRLRDLLVQSVQPAPDSTRLLVTVYPGPAAQAFDVEEIVESLHRARGMLRSKVANAIHRKRTPELVFQVLNETAR
ncbi:MAG TPA: ribosome-binding factor A [Gemmataceae bacterium]|jgi:ribosome-binding factor A|nr:ribosome-binding factor A [Gemmataceae bacterium]